MARPSGVSFFNPSDIFTGSDALDDWELQTGKNPAKARQRAQALKKNGDELAFRQYDEKTSITLSFTAKTYTDGAFLDVPPAGKIVNGFHIDTIAVSYSQTGFPTLNITGHAHKVGTSLTHDNCRVYSPSVKFPARAIGVPAALPKVGTGTPGNAFALSTNANVAMRGLNYSLSVNHIDVQDENGEHLAGNNHDGVETINPSFTGAASSSDYTFSSDFSIDNENESESNTAENSSSVSASHHLQYDTELTPEGAEN